MKGRFLQGLVVLTRGAVTIEDIAALLRPHALVRTEPAGDHPAVCGPSGVIAYRPEVNGAVVVDVVDLPWPDHMGDPQQDPELFGAWAAGAFGPFVHPACLERAVLTALAWPAARDEVPRHTGFVRLRVSYTLDAGPDASLVPADRDPRHELDFVTALAAQLLQHRAALCFFNPSGEVVLPAAMVREALDHAQGHGLPPLELWAVTRLLAVTDDWEVMDCVGNAQLDLPDIEVAFPKGSLQLEEIHQFIRGATLYLLTGSGVFADGDTMDGELGTRLQVTAYHTAVTSPPRRVLCWLPLGAKRVPPLIADRAIVGAAPRSPAKKPWWEPW